MKNKHHYYFLPAALILFAGCLRGPAGAKPAALQAAAPAAIPAGEVRSGIDVLEEENFASLAGRRVGLITNHTGKDRHGIGTVEVLAKAPGVTLAAVFSPEHGFLGDLDREGIDSSTITVQTSSQSALSLPVYSLYGPTKRPTPKMLQDIDILVFDIQDIGARFYTYLTTMGYAMEEAAKNDVDFMVLDRPNPINGITVEGGILENYIRHFTAYYTVPTRHAMTAGEIALFHNGTQNMGAELRVIPMKGWKRSMWYDQTGLPWIATSPNMPDLTSAALYPGIGCFEATNLSVGRGTPTPFGIIGSPWLRGYKKIADRLNKLNLPGVRFRTKTFTPVKEPFKGRLCRGIEIEVTDRDKIRPFSVFTYLICAIRDTNFGDFEIRWEEMARMVGNDVFKLLYLAGAHPEEIETSMSQYHQEFLETRKPYLLY